MLVILTFSIDFKPLDLLATCYYENHKGKFLSTLFYSVPHVLALAASLVFDVLLLRRQRKVVSFHEEIIRTDDAHKVSETYSILLFLLLSKEFCLQTNRVPISSLLVVPIRATLWSTIHLIIFLIVIPAAITITNGLDYLFYVIRIAALCVQTFR